MSTLHPLTIGCYCADPSEFQVLATLSADPFSSAEQRNAAAIRIMESLSAQTGRLIVALEREDAADFIALDGFERHALCVTAAKKGGAA